jgi:hypothetical protein
MSTVCLEFNKEDPRPSMKYEIKPAADYIKDPAIFEIIRMVANDEITQQIAQAAAWHRTDGLSWDFLVHHNRKELSNGYFERFFSPQEIRWAMQVVPVADQRAATRRVTSGEDSRDWRSDR